MATVLHRELRLEGDRRGDAKNLRIVMLHDDCQTFSVGLMAEPIGADKPDVACEVTQRVDQIHRLARAILAGDDRAKTTPGLARRLAGAVVLLTQVAANAGAFEDAPEGGEVGDA